MCLPVCEYITIAIIVVWNKNTVLFVTVSIITFFSVFIVKDKSAVLAFLTAVCVLFVL